MDKNVKLVAQGRRLLKGAQYARRIAEIRKAVWDAHEGQYRHSSRGKRVAIRFSVELEIRRRIKELAPKGAVYLARSQKR